MLMDPARISELLQPFLATPLSEVQLNNISTYIDILLHWNTRINLTAVRDPEEIVTRHLGESLFAARHLFPESGGTTGPSAANDLTDIGSGAGFPGLPLKLWAPGIHLTLIESNHKKATFLREVVRGLTLMNVDVFPGRAEDFPTPAQVVTLRAVERFDTVLPIATRLLTPTGRLVLMIGQAQVSRAYELAPNLTWSPAIPIPHSATRTLLIGTRVVSI
jgi:16S rRNA (guanine527-N7)-methyltransferase